MSEQDRLSNCKFVKTMLMISVVVYHCILFWNGEWFSEVEKVQCGTNGFDLLTGFLSKLHVFCFALVSGYIFRHIKFEKMGYKEFLPFIGTKFLRLIVPMLFVSAIWVVPVEAYYFDYDILTVLKRYILMTGPKQLWFLVMLFNVFWIAYFLSNFWEKHPFGGLCSVILLYGVGTVGEELFVNVFQIWTSLTYVFFFWFGFYLRKYRESVLWKIPAIVYILLIIVLTVGNIYVNAFDGKVLKLMRPLVKVVLRVLEPIGAFIVLQKLASRIDCKNKVLEFLGDNSMVVYLFHQQFIYFTIIWFNGILNPWIHAGVNFVFSFGISLFLAFILKKNKVICLLLGEK